MAEIKSNQWTLVDTCTHPERPLKIKWQGLRVVSSSHATLQHLNAPSSIKHTRLKCNNLNPSISSELLIEDEMPNPTATANFAYIHACSSTM